MVPQSVGLSDCLVGGGVRLPGGAAGQQSHPSARTLSNAHGSLLTDLPGVRQDISRLPLSPQRRSWSRPQTIGGSKATQFPCNFCAGFCVAASEAVLAQLLEKHWRSAETFLAGPGDTLDCKKKGGSGKSIIALSIIRLGLGSCSSTADSRCVPGPANRDTNQLTEISAG